MTFLTEFMLLSFNFLRPYNFIIFLCHSFKIRFQFNAFLFFRLTELENLGHLTADVNKRNIQDMVQRLAYSDWLILHYLAQVSIVFLIASRYFSIVAIFSVIGIGIKAKFPIYVYIF